MSAASSSPSPAGDLSAGTFPKDLMGAFNSAATSFAVAVGGGVLIFAPLGEEWLPYGIVASIIATVGGGTIASVFSSAPVSLSSPRAAVCIVLASFVATVSRSIPGLAPPGIIALTSLVVVLAGLIQVLAAVLRLGRLIRYVPFPVVAGFTHGIALSLLLVFVPLLLGLTDVPRVALPRLDLWHWGAPLAGVVALAAIFLTTRRSARLPAVFVGMAAGVVFYLGVTAIFPSIDAGATLKPGLVPSMSSPFLGWEALPILLRDPAGLRLLLSFSLALAAVASIDSMIGSMAVETRYHVRTRPDRDLLAQGLGNIVAGTAGGAAIAYSTVSVQSARSVGASGILVGPMMGAGVAIIAIAFALFVKSVPLAVLAALMVFLAFRLADPWGYALVRLVARRRLKLDAITAESFVVYLLVALAIVLLDIVTALTVGLVASIVIFIRTMNQHVVRKVTVGLGVRSHRRYPPAVMPLLGEAMKTVAVVELEGPLFFGTADRISAAVERLPKSVRFVVLDLRRVQGLDASAGAVLTRTNARLASQNRALLLAGRAMESSSLGAGLPQTFPDRDRAVEWVENRILEEEGVHTEEMALEPEAIGRGLGLGEAETRNFLGATVVTDLPAGEAVFHQGDTGSELYFLLAGRLSIYLEGGGGKRTRVATFMPGNAFGEMAFIDGGARTASAVCDVPCRVLMLSKEGLARLADVAPEVVSRIYASLAQDISGRLRNTDQMLRVELEG